MSDSCKVLEKQFLNVTFIDLRGLIGMFNFWFIWQLDYRAMLTGRMAPRRRNTSIVILSFLLAPTAVSDTKVMITEHSKADKNLKKRYYQLKSRPTGWQTGGRLYHSQNIYNYDEIKIFIITGNESRSKRNHRDMETCHESESGIPNALQWSAENAGADQAAHHT